MNEQDTLGSTLDALPTQIDGIDIIERLIIDDGSSDDTVKRAKELGVEHIISHGRNQGLASAFTTGLRYAISKGADIIVNTDGDNQYNGEDLPLLIEPILSGRAELVVGQRPIANSRHFSFFKKVLQKMGSWFVGMMSGAVIPDAPSGFRAMTRDTALRLNLFSKYTYTLEMLIQAGRSGIAMEFVPIRTNPPTRPSRLMSNMFTYIIRSIVTVVRIFIVYRPFRFFAIVGTLPFSIGMFLSLRWLYFQYADIGGDHIQSLILAAILFITAMLCWALGVIGDLLSINRTILQEVQFKLRRDDLNRHSKSQD